MNLLIPLTVDSLESLLFFYKYGFGIKYVMKFGVPLDKERKQKKSKRDFNFGIYFLNLFLICVFLLHVF